MIARPPAFDASYERYLHARWRWLAYEQIWADVYLDGAHCGFTGSFWEPRDADGFPCGFANWPLHKRDAWRAGYDRGLHDFLRLVAERDRVGRQ